jgi:predicted kinase
VRAKVDLIEAQQHADAAGPHRRALERLHTAKRLTQNRTRVLIVMHGASGSGKSWLSERLAPEIGAVRMRSDLERKRLAGLDPLTPWSSAFNEGIYTQAFNDKTYAHLLECALACLRGGFNVIVDAAFLKHGERDAFARLAAQEGTRFMILSCDADPATLAARIEARRAVAADPSDATVDVLRYQLETMQPLDRSEEPHLVRIDTRDPDVLADAVRRIEVAAI